MSMTREQQLEVFHDYLGAAYYSANRVRLAGSGYAREDARQESAMGAWKCITRMDGKDSEKMVKDKVFRYSLTAAMRGLAAGRHFPLPTEVFEICCRASALLDKSGVDPGEASEEEIAEACLRSRPKPRSTRKDFSAKIIRQAYGLYGMRLDASSDESYDIRESTEPAPSERLEREDTARVVREELDAIDPHIRSLLRMRCQEEMSLEAIASEMETSVYVIRKHLNAAMSRLRSNPRLQELVA